MALNFVQKYGPFLSHLMSPNWPSYGPPAHNMEQQSDYDMRRNEFLFFTFFFTHITCMCDGLPRIQLFHYVFNTNEDKPSSCLIRLTNTQPSVIRTTSLAYKSKYMQMCTRKMKSSRYKMNCKVAIQQPKYVSPTG